MAENLGARKDGEFKAVSTAPSFNKTPVGAATPPLPYPVSQDLGDSVGTVSNVRFNGNPAYVMNQSTQPSCIGDAAGSAGGVKSGTVGGEVKPVKGSSTVRIEGKPVLRVEDPCTLNGGNCPGVYVTTTAPTGEIKNGRPTVNCNPPVEPETPAEKSWWQAASPWVHGLLGVASFVPGVSVVTGGADALIYAAEGDAIEAGLAAASMIPGGKVVTTVGKAGKAAVNAVKGARIAEDAAKVAKAAKEAEEAAKAAKLAKEAQAAKEAEEAAATGKDGFKVKGQKTAEKGKCGEWLAKLDMAKEGFDEIVAVQNNSNQGVDLVGRNSKTGEVKVWEVKATETNRAGSLRGDQKSMGGKDFTNDRLDRAMRGEGNYGKVPEAVKNAETVDDWLKKAKIRNATVSHEKREVFLDDIDKGCAKHPNRPSKSRPWIAK